MSPNDSSRGMLVPTLQTWLRTHRYKIHCHRFASCQFSNIWKQTGVRIKYTEAIVPRRWITGFTWTVIHLEWKSWHMKAHNLRGLQLSGAKMGQRSHASWRGYEAEQLPGDFHNSQHVNEQTRVTQLTQLSLLDLLLCDVTWPPISIQYSNPFGQKRLCTYQCRICDIGRWRNK